MNPVTDEQVDELLKTESPPQSLDYESQKQWTLGQYLASKPYYYASHDFKCFNEFYNLIRTVTFESFKKLCAFNPKFASIAFGSIAEQSRKCVKMEDGKFDFSSNERIQIIDWIIDSKLVSPKDIILWLVKFTLIDQINKIFKDPSIDEYALHSCLTELCCWMHKSEGGWSENLINRERVLFDLFFNDPRLDVSSRDNAALGFAIGHKNQYAIDKLLADSRVLACENWSIVLDNCFHDNEMLKKILEFPNAKFDRTNMIDLKNYVDRDEYKWLKTHPKYIEANETVFLLKTPEQLLQSAFKANGQGDHEKVSQILNIMSRRIRGEPEDPDIHYDDECEVYVYNTLRWYQRNFYS